MKKIMLISNLFLISCNYGSIEKNNQIESTPRLYEVCPENKMQLDDLNTDIVKLIPEKELIFLQEDLRLTSKMQSFYDVDLSTGGKYFLSDYFRIDNMEAYVLFSDFGISNSFPCRQKIFFFVNGKFQKAISLSGWLGDSSELLSYKSRIHVDTKTKIIQIERFQTYYYEDIFSEQASVTENYFEILEINCSNLSLNKVKKNNSEWNNEGFSCD